MDFVMDFVFAACLANMCDFFGKEKRRWLKDIDLITGINHNRFLLLIEKLKSKKFAHRYEVLTIYVKWYEGFA